MATSRPSRFPNVPYAYIRHVVGNWHVSTPDSEVKSGIESRLRRLRLAGLKRATVRGLSEGSIKEGVRYALACHHENREEYRRVMGGLL